MQCVHWGAEVFRRRDGIYAGQYESLGLHAFARCVAPQPGGALEVDPKRHRKQLELEFQAH